MRLYSAIYRQTPCPLFTLQASITFHSLHLAPPSPSPPPARFRLSRASLRRCRCLTAPCSWDTGFMVFRRKAPVNSPCSCNTLKLNPTQCTAPPFHIAAVTHARTNARTHTHARAHVHKHTHRRKHTSCSCNASCSPPSLSTSISTSDGSPFLPINQFVFS